MAKKKSKMPHGAGESIHDNAVAGKQSMSESDSMWSRKGATMSDKSARQEFGLTQQEIIAAIRVGKLQFREATCTATRGIGYCGTKSNLSFETRAGWTT